MRTPIWPSLRRIALGGAALLVLSLATLFPAAEAATYTVPTDAASVIEALAMTEPGDQVYVLPGTYVETENIVVPVGRTFTGAGRDAVRIQGPFLWIDQTAPGESATTTISRITFEQVGGSEWDAVISEENDDLHIHDCRLRVVGQVYLEGGGRVERNEVLFLDPYQFARLVVYANESTFVVEENVVLTSAEVSGGYLGASGTGSVLVARHNTFVNPWWAQGAFATVFDITTASGGTLEFTSNILFANNLRCSGSAIERGYNAMFDNPPALCQHTETDINPDPDTYFCDVGDLDGFDWRLQPDSPCIGAGEGGTNIGASLGVGCGIVDVESAVVSVAPRVHAVPNPSIGAVAFEVEGLESWTKIEIYDVAGRLVWRASHEDASAPIWPGTTKAGAPVPAGTYLARLTTERGVIGARITRVE